MNTLFNKVLGENEKCVFYFYLKTEGNFWPTQYFIPGRRLSFHIVYGFLYCKTINILICHNDGHISLACLFIHCFNKFY